MILDLGSGYPFKERICLKGENIIHFDLSPEAYHLEAMGNALCLPFKDAIFTTVHASHILEHVENPSQMLREISRVLKPGANSKAIIKVPNASFFRWKTSGRGHISSWGEHELSNLLYTVFPKVTITPTPRNVGSRARKLLNITLRLFYGCNEITAVCHLS